MIFGLLSKKRFLFCFILKLLPAFNLSAFRLPLTSRTWVPFRGCCATLTILLTSFVIRSQAAIVLFFPCPLCVRSLFDLPRPRIRNSYVNIGCQYR